MKCLPAFLEWIGWPMVADKSEGRVWRLKWALSFVLEEGRLPAEGLRPGMDTGKGKEAKASLAAKDPFLAGIPKVFDLSKRQTIELLYRAVSNLVEDENVLDSLVDAWNDHEGWSATTREKGIGDKAAGTS